MTHASSASVYIVHKGPAGMTKAECQHGPVRQTALPMPALALSTMFTKLLLVSTEVDCLHGKAFFGTVAALPDRLPVRLCALDCMFGSCTNSTPRLFWETCTHRHFRWLRMYLAFGGPSTAQEGILADMCTNTSHHQS